MTKPYALQADEPQAGLSAEQLLMGYCRDSDTHDVLIPNRDDGDIFWRRREQSAYRPKSRAGALSPEP